MFAVCHNWDRLRGKLYCQAPMSAKTPLRKGAKRLPRCDTLPRNWKKSQPKASDNENTNTSSSFSRGAGRATSKRTRSKRKKAMTMRIQSPAVGKLSSSSSALLSCTVSPTNLAGDSPTAKALRGAFHRTASRKRLQGGSRLGGSDANIRVYVRVRPEGVSATSPSSNSEANETVFQDNLDSPNSFAAGEKPFEVTSETTLVHRISGKHGKTFTFDGIFDSVECSQSRVFETLGQRQVDKALCGFNGSLFAYGQTGSGKTYTMLGPSSASLNEHDHDEHAGLIPRVLAYLFEKKRMAEAIPEEGNPSKDSPISQQVDNDDAKVVSSSTPSCTKTMPSARKISDLTVRVSYLEIYRERIADLLNVQEISKTSKAFTVSSTSSKIRAPSLRLKEDKKTGPFVEGLRQIVVKSPEEALSIMAKGNESRTMASTKMNNTSSRSHAVFTICIDGKIDENFGDSKHDNRKEGRKKQSVQRRRFSSRINLVDLAGSERQSGTGATGVRQKEGSAINKSLSVLGTVIMNLVDIGDGKARHIHYRDSKLTFLLRDSLGGNTFTTIIATVTSLPKHAQETLSTLHFAQRAKSVRNRVTRNVITDDATRVQELQREVRRLKRQIRSEARGNSDEGAKLTRKGPFSMAAAGLARLDEKEAADAALRNAKEARAQLKAELNEQIAKEVALQKQYKQVEDKMSRMAAERDKAVQDAAAREQELEELRLEHATLASKRRRSSISFRRRQSRMSAIGAPLSPILPEGLMDRIQEQVRTEKKNKELALGVKEEQQSTCTAMQTDPVKFAKDVPRSSASTMTTSSLKSTAAQTAETEQSEVSIVTNDSSVQCELEFDEVLSTAKTDRDLRNLNAQELLRELLNQRKYLEEAQSSISKLSATAANTQKELSEECNVLRERCDVLESEKASLLLKQNKISQNTHISPNINNSLILGSSLLPPPSFALMSHKAVDMSNGLMKVMEQKLEKKCEELELIKTEKEALKAENRRLRTSAKRLGSLGNRSSTNSLYSDVEGNENRNTMRAGSLRNSRNSSFGSPYGQNSTSKLSISKSSSSSRASSPVLGGGGVSGPPGPKREDSFSSGTNTRTSVRARSSLKDLFYN